MIIRPHDPNGENPAARPLQLRRSDILQPGTSVPGTLPHRDHAPIADHPISRISELLPWNIISAVEVST